MGRWSTRSSERSIRAKYIFNILPNGGVFKSLKARQAGLFERLWIDDDGERSPAAAGRRYDLKRGVTCEMTRVI
jgi:hypothetical protein